jgi:hypothetical protein
MRLANDGASVRGDAIVRSTNPLNSSQSPQNVIKQKAVNPLPASKPRDLTDAELELDMQATLPVDIGQSNLAELSDKSFDDISNLLLQAGREEWSFRPRTYAVLRMINMVKLLDVFISDDLWDIALPFAYNNLPLSLSPSQRKRFLEKQGLVLTKAARIEGGSGSSHANLGELQDRSALSATRRC